MTDGNNSNTLTLSLVSFSQNSKPNNLNHASVSNKTKLLQSTVEISEESKINSNVPPKEIDKLKHLTRTSLIGLLTSGFTHTLVTPLDVVKTQLQVYPNLYKNLITAFKEINIEYGSDGLYRGWKPICLGYSLHGFVQLGLFEYYKNVYSKWYSNTKIDSRHSKHKIKITMLAATTSELFATLILCPFEAIKVKYQTNNLRHYQEAKRNILVYEGVSGFYKGLLLMWSRQIPYSVIKFTAYEELMDYAYSTWLHTPKHNYSHFVQNLISFGAGFLSGIIGAIITNPADTYVARLYHTKYPAMSKRTVLAGYNGQLFCLCVRMLMLGTINGLQFWIYNNLKITNNRNVVLV